MQPHWLTPALIELADELDKGPNMDPCWMKYQGPVVRAAIAALQQHNDHSPTSEVQAPKAGFPPCPDYDEHLNDGYDPDTLGVARVLGSPSLPIALEDGTELEHEMQTLDEYEYVCLCCGQQFNAAPSSTHFKGST